MKIPHCDKMVVPLPKFSKGDEVASRFNNGTGIILSRSYDNLNYASYWMYQVEWENGEITNHHYCCDLVLVCCSEFKNLRF